MEVLYIIGEMGIITHIWDRIVKKIPKIHFPKLICFKIFLSQYLMWKAFYVRKADTDYSITHTLTLYMYLFPRYESYPIGYIKTQIPQSFFSFQLFYADKRYFCCRLIDYCRTGFLHEVRWQNGHSISKISFVNYTFREACIILFM